MPSTQPESLLELCRFDKSARPWRVDLVLPDIGGGKASTDQLSAIEDYPQATALTISGLDQRTFEALIARYGDRFLGLHLWKCPRIERLSPLESLPQLTHVAIYWNQRTSQLWNFKATPALRGLQFEDFTRLRDLSDLQAAVSLNELRFGDAVWRKSVFQSLQPLEALHQLTSLRFYPKLIADRRVQPLARLRRLESIDFPANQFSTEQHAWLRAHLPAATQGRVLEPIKVLDKPIGEGPHAKDVMVMGKRKPWLNSKTDAARVKRYVDDFWRMVDTFREDPQLDPKVAK